MEKKRWCYFCGSYKCDSPLGLEAAIEHGAKPQYEMDGSAPEGLFEELEGLREKLRELTRLREERRATTLGRCEWMHGTAHEESKKDATRAWNEFLETVLNLGSPSKLVFVDDLVGGKIAGLEVSTDLHEARLAMYGEVLSNYGERIAQLEKLVRQLFSGGDR